MGGKKVGKNPTERGKLGTKRRLLTDGHGLPLGVAGAGANRHDMKLVEATLEAIMIKRPEPTATQPQHLCLDKGYDDEAVSETLEAWGYTAHIRHRAKKCRPSARSRATGRGAGWWSARMPG